MLGMALNSRQSFKNGLFTFHYQLPLGQITEATESEDAEEIFEEFLSVV